MKNGFRRYLSVGFLLMSLSLGCFAQESAQEYAIVGTGGVTGVYYPAGGSICRMVNRQRSQHGIRCAVESTQGSIYNLEKVRERDLDFAVVQSDWHFHAVNGSAGFADAGADTTLRSVFSLYAEPFTVVARVDSGIKTFGDLKGKRVNIGNIGSGQRATMEALMKTLGWMQTDFAETHALKSVDQAKALCDNRFDAMVFVAGHPSASIKEATTSCDSRLIPVRGPEIDQLVAANSYYLHIEIPGGMYRGNDHPVKTFGVGATIVSSSEVSSKVIYEVVKAVFDNLESFKQLHPAFQGLSKKKMLELGLTAPLHEGALKYFREARVLGKN